MGFLSNYWEYIIICFLLVDKAVALSPSKMDDLIWTMVKKMLKKAAGKQIVFYGTVINYFWERMYTAPPCYARLTCSDGSLIVVYSSPEDSEEEDA